MGLGNGSDGLSRRVPKAKMQRIAPSESCAHLNLVVSAYHGGERVSEGGTNPDMAARMPPL